MPQSRQSPARSVFGSLVLIALVIGGSAAAFAYTAGRFSPNSLTPARFVAAFTPPTGEPLGHRRNHAKGICSTGVFETNGAATALSHGIHPCASPAVGRFNLGTPDPNAPDATVRVRRMGLQIATPEGGRRSAMVNPPIFPVSTPQGFYELLLASASKDPDAMKTFATAHPEFAPFGVWATSSPWTGSYAEERYNGLNSFVITDRSGAEHTVRSSLLPEAQPVWVLPDDLAKRGPNFLEQEITERPRGGPQRWTMVVTVAYPGDPSADTSKVWPEDRRTVEIGTLMVSTDRTRAERPVPRHQLLIRPSCRPVYGRRTTRFRPHGRPFTGSHMTSARPRRSTTPGLQGTPSHDRIPPALHTTAAPTALADGDLHLTMLFIGIGMVSTVNPKYLTLVSIHKPLGIAILMLALIRLTVRLRYGTPPLPADLPEPTKLGAGLSHYALYV